MSFERAIEFTLKWEGYKSEDASDPGGRTIFGISYKSHPEEVRRMWDLPKEEALEIAKEIYRIKYWEPSGCDLLPEPFDLCLFDISVNMGIGRAKTISREAKGWEDCILLRLEKYLSMRKQYPQFIFGWINRTMDLWRVAREIV